MPSSEDFSAPTTAAPADATAPQEVPGPVLYVVRNEHDDPVPFRDGTRERFGRDDYECRIAAWSQMDAALLSRVAGELWCDNGRMWVRNDSAAHELVVSGRHGQRGKLAPRRQGMVGDSMTVPLPDGSLTVPTAGPWRLVIERAAPLPGPASAPGRPAAGAVPAVDGNGRQALPGSRETVRVGAVPDGCRDVANALCSPLLAGKPMPATYNEIARACGVSMPKARRTVIKLCEAYLPQIRALSPQEADDEERLAAAVAWLLVDREKVPAPPDDLPWRQDQRLRAALAARTAWKTAKP